MPNSERVTQRGLSRILHRLEAAANALILRVSAVGDELTEAERSAVMLTQAAGVSLHSLHVLLDKSFMGARDAFGISRGICDACVNAAYLLAEPSSAAKATAYSLQRFHRDASRDSSLAGFRIRIGATYPSFMHGMDGLDAALAQFTRASGGEIREWSGKSVDQKIELIASRSEAGKSLALCRLLIYGVSSEMIHGSPYGVMYFWTALGAAPANSSEAKRKMMLHYTTAILGAALAFDGLVSTWEANRPGIRFGWESGWLFALLEKLVRLEIENEEKGGN